MKTILLSFVLLVSSTIESQEIKYDSWFGGSIGIVAGGYNPSGEGEVMMFTYPNKSNYNWNDFIKDRLTMFQYYRKKNKNFKNVFNKN